MLAADCAKVPDSKDEERKMTDMLLAKGVVFEADKIRGKDREKYIGKICQRARNAPNFRLGPGSGVEKPVARDHVKLARMGSEWHTKFTRMAAAANAEELEKDPVLEAYLKKSDREKLQLIEGFTLSESKEIHTLSKYDLDENDPDWEIFRAKVIMHVNTKANLATLREDLDYLKDAHMQGLFGQYANPSVIALTTKLENAINAALV